MKSYWHRFGTAAVMSVALCTIGCEGSILSGGGGDANTPGPDQQEPVYEPGPIMERMPTPDDCESGDDIFANDAPARLLTRYEFDNTVRDLFGVDASLAREKLPPENATDGFENSVHSHVVSSLWVRKLMEVSEQIAPQAVQNGALDRGLADLLYRAFRRPPTTDEVSGFEALRSTAAEQWGQQRADEMVVMAIMQAPQFLYRAELVGPEVPREIVALDSFQMASRLSYMLWGSMPDAELFAAAEAGALQTDAEVEVQVRRMLDDPRSRETIGHFYRQWLHLDSLNDMVKDVDSYGLIAASLSDDWRASIDAWVDWVHFEADGRLETLMSSPTVFMTPYMAAHMQVQVPEAMEAMELEQRAGLLTQPALLALLAYPNQGSPIHRGIFVREKLLCQKLGPPPDDMVIEPPDPDPNATTRQQFAQHTEIDTCAGCHRLIDPLGFGFENYDGVGLYRTEENGLPIDASGELWATGDEDLDGPFDGAMELSERLTASDAVQECVAEQWMTFAFGQPPTRADLCTVKDVQSRFSDSDGSFKELLVAIAMSDAVRYRVIQGPE